MTIYYSPEKKGFYDTDFPYPTLPDDLIEITADQHQALLNALNMDGKEIYIDGGVIKTRRPVKVITWNDVRVQRNRLLNGSDYTQMPDWPGDKAAWATYRQTLRDIPQTYSDPNDVVWPTPPGE